MAIGYPNIALPDQNGKDRIEIEDIFNSKNLMNIDETCTIQSEYVGEFKDFIERYLGEYNPETPLSEIMVRIVMKFFEDTEKSTGFKISYEKAIELLEDSNRSIVSEFREQYPNSIFPICLIHREDGSHPENFGYTIGVYPGDGEPTTTEIYTNTPHPYGDGFFNLIIPRVNLLYTDKNGDTHDVNLIYFIDSLVTILSRFNPILNEMYSHRNEPNTPRINMGIMLTLYSSKEYREQLPKALEVLRPFIVSSELALNIKQKKLNKPFTIATLFTATKFLEAAVLPLLLKLILRSMNADYNDMLDSMGIPEDDRPERSNMVIRSSETLVRQLERFLGNS